MDPRKPLNKLYFSYIYFFNSLTIETKFHEVAKYIIFHSKMELLQPSGSLSENKKIST